MVATFTIYMTTSAAPGTFTRRPELIPLLRQIYLAHFQRHEYKPSGPLRFISLYLDRAYGNFLETDAGDQNDARYIRIVVDIAAGIFTVEEKQAFVRGVVEACVLSQGKKAKECEIEVKVCEVQEEDHALKRRGE